MDFFLSKDTSLQAAKVQFNTLKKLTLSQKLAMTLELCENLREIKFTGIKLQNPLLSENLVANEYLKLILNQSVYYKFFQKNKSST